MLGNLFVETPKLDSVLHYKRALDINKSIATTTFESNGIGFKREYFSSFPDKAIILILSHFQAFIISENFILKIVFQKPRMCGT